MVLVAAFCGFVLGALVASSIHARENTKAVGVLYEEITARSRLVVILRNALAQSADRFALCSRWLTQKGDGPGAATAEQYAVSALGAVRQYDTQLERETRLYATKRGTPNA